MSLKKLLPAALGLIALQAVAWDDGCRARDDRKAEIDAAGVERVEIIATAGDLDVFGQSGATKILAAGKACAYEDDDLARIQLHAERDGSTVRVIADIPPDVVEAFLDLRVEVPAGVLVHVTDTSGDVNVKQVAALEVRDSSGDLQVDQVPGAVTLEDSSGDIYVDDSGEVHIVSDSSGDIRISRAHSVRIDVDSSGEIVVRDVQGDVSVGDDSSGSIDVSDVGGDFSVDHDGSGEIDYSHVNGKVRIPSNKDSD